jgi:hypothetical protein
MHSTIAKSNPEAPLTARPTTGETHEVVPEVFTPMRRKPPEVESYIDCPNCETEMLYGHGCEACGLSDPR